MWFSDYLILLVYIVPFMVILIATLLTEYLIRLNKAYAFNGRKLLHILSLFCCAFSVHYAPERILHIYLFSGAAMLLFILIRFKIFFSNTGSYGIALFPLAFALLLSFSFLNTDQIVFSMLTLAFSDAAAGLIGFHFSKQKIVFWQESKSWLGFLSFYCSTLVIYLVLFGWSNNHFTLALVIALVPALSELFSYKGSDNLTTPVLTGLWIYLIQNNNTFFIVQLVIIIILSGLAILGFSKKILDKTGAVAALLTGLIVCLSVEVNYIFAMAFFLLTGSLISRLNRSTLEKEGRNAIQVFANGLVALLCIIAFAITKNTIFELAYFASIGISLCDTVSSESGKYFKRKTIDILTLKRTTVGISGGISFPGTLFSTVVTFIYAFFLYLVYAISLQQCIWIAIIGIAGMLADSILGSSVQALYQLEGTLNENAKGVLIKGKNWCTNDLVNLLSNGIVIASFLCTVFFVLK